MRASRQPAGSAPLATQYPPVWAAWDGRVKWRRGSCNLRVGMGGARDGTQDRMQQSDEDNVQDKVAVLIAGPTASGKSALALALAERIGGVVVNTDSMQVYRTLRVITARPSGAEMARVPHLLYGHVDAAPDYSVGRFLRRAAAS